jgi:hypothetical protein
VFVGPIFATILLVECLFFLFLEWWMPREALDYVREDWRAPAGVASTHGGELDVLEHTVDEQDHVDHIAQLSQNDSGGD